jgi:hypothetical protein
MGCDIHILAERKSDAGYEAVTDIQFSEGTTAPFDWRSYGMYGFLAGVRNYSAVPPIAERRGLPSDASADVREGYEGWGSDAHSVSWLSVEELAAFDYAKPMEDRRVTIDNDGGRTAPPGGGSMTTYHDFLGDQFFDDLKKLQEAGVDRVVFWFDN